MFNSQLLHKPPRALPDYEELKVNYTKEKLSKRVISSSGLIFNFKECCHVLKHKFMEEPKIAVQVTEPNFPNELWKTENKAG
jgi:hypothetical protein